MRTGKSKVQKLFGYTDAPCANPSKDPFKVSWFTRRFKDKGSKKHESVDSIMNFRFSQGAS